jgi:hypothetical protein
MVMEIKKEWMRLPASEVKKALSPSRNEAHILPLVTARIAPAIDRHSLAARRDAYNEAILENSICRVNFSGLYEDRVLCRFSSKKHGGGKDFDLSLYLYVRFGDWALELLPCPDDSWDDEKRVLHYLDGFNALLLDGWLQEPLEGDFSWVADYRRIEAEGHALLPMLDSIKTMDLAAWTAIRVKLAASDHSWMNDARDFIASHTQHDQAATVPPNTENRPVQVGVS